jgi:hypothetical protein
MAVEQVGFHHALLEMMSTQDVLVNTISVRQFRRVEKLTNKSCRSGRRGIPDLFFGQTEGTLQRCCYGRHVNI